MKQRLKQRLRQIAILKNERGMAMLMTLFAVALMTLIVFEVAYDTNVEYNVTSNEISHLKAYYAAKAAVELNLLRIQIYKKVIGQLGENAKSLSNELDQIWNFPMMWPPVLPTEATLMVKDSVQTAVSTSLMDASYNVVIQGEGGKIDVNDLGSPSESLRNLTRAQLIRMFDNQVKSDEKFGSSYSMRDFEKLVNNMTDWIDEDSTSLNGGDENSEYNDIDSDGEDLPPNQPFKTLQELHMVSGMTDEIYRFLAPKITVYGIKGIQVNTANAEVLKAIDPQITDEVAEAIKKRRDDLEIGGPFRDSDDFFKFLQTAPLNVLPERFNQETLPYLSFDPEMNFRIKATGLSGNASSDIVAIVFDFASVRDRFVNAIETENKRKQSTGQPGQSPTPSQPGAQGTNPNPNPDPKNNKPPNPVRGRPNVIYWYQD